MSKQDLHLHVFKP